MKMKYIVIDLQTRKPLFEAQTLQEASLFAEYLKENSYYIYRHIKCRECDNEGFKRQDIYGISTGHWCEECYTSNKYPYRKDSYPTIEHDGYGETLGLEDNSVPNFLQGLYSHFD